MLRASIWLGSAAHHVVTASGKSRWTSVGGLLAIPQPHTPPLDPDLDGIDTVVLGRTQELGLDIHWYLSFLDLDLDLFRIW